MKEVIYKSADSTMTILLQFRVQRRLKFTHLGKGWPKHTQCLMFIDGLLEHFETIVKHKKDEDNQLYAYKFVAEKCLKNIPNKWIRGQVRIELDKFMEEEKALLNQAIESKVE
jgi:retron-type reverse transcriptase